MPAGRKKAKLTAADMPAGRKKAKLTAADMPAGRKKAKLTAADMPAGRKKAKLTAADMPAGRKKAKLTAADMPAGRKKATDRISSSQGCQTQEVKQCSENTVMNVGKNSSTVMPLSRGKHTCVALKRKAVSNYDTTEQSNHTPVAPLSRGKHTSLAVKRKTDSNYDTTEQSNHTPVAPLSRGKHTSVAVKRKADSNYGATEQSNHTPVAPLSRGKHTSVAGKRKADSNYDTTEQSNHTPVAPLSCGKHTSVAVKRKADSNYDTTEQSKHTSVAGKRKVDSNYDTTGQRKHTPDLSSESVEPILYMDSDTNVADEKTQNYQGEIQETTETSDVQTNVLHNFILSHSISQVIKLLEVIHPFSQDDLDKALILTCQRGYKYIAQKLIDSGANVQCRDPEGNTPLMICSKNGFIDLIQFLLTRNPDLDAANSAGDTALILCIRASGSTQIAKLFLRNSRLNIDHQNEEGYTALMKAVEAFDIGTAYILLERIFEMYSTFPDPWWKIHSFTYDNCQEATTEEVFEKHGLSLIFKMSKACIEYQKNLSGYDGKPSPLDLAVQVCDVDALNLFLNNVDLDENIKRKMISVAYTNLFEHKFKEMNVFSECHISMVKRLLELGASLVVTARVSPICIATEAGSYPLVELICQHGAYHSYWLSGPPPLSIAARMGRCDLIELILKYRVNSNPFNLSSALDIARCHGHTDCAKLLMQKNHQG